MIVLDTTMDPHEHVSNVICQNNVMKLFYFVKSHLFIYLSFFYFIIYLFTNLLFCYVVEIIYEHSKVEYKSIIILLFTFSNLIFYLFYICYYW